MPHVAAPETGSAGGPDRQSSGSMGRVSIPGATAATPVSHARTGQIPGGKLGLLDDRRRMQRPARKVAQDGTALGHEASPLRLAEPATPTQG